MQVTYKKLHLNILFSSLIWEPEYLRFKYVNRLLVGKLISNKKNAVYFFEQQKLVRDNDTYRKRVE